MTPAIHATLAKKGARWFDRMKGCVVELSDGKFVKVVELCKKDHGVNDLGVWWNDAVGSTHLRKWDEVDLDLGA